MRRKYFILMLVLMLSIQVISCAKKKEKAISDEDMFINLKAGLENSIKYKITLLCLKYEISSGDLKQDLIDLFVNQSPIIQLFENGINKGKKEEITISTIMKSINKSYKLVALKKLNVLCEKYHVTIKTLSSLIYDYEVWEKIEG